MRRDGVEEPIAKDEGGNNENAQITESYEHVQMCPVAVVQHENTCNEKDGYRHQRNFFGFSSRNQNSSKGYFSFF